MPHFSDYSNTASPGDGVTQAHMSKEPLATEGEATPGPDDENPFDDMLDAQQRRGATRGTSGPAALPDVRGPDLSLPDFF